jgi:hypothetical protein
MAAASVRLGTMLVKFTYLRSLLAIALGCLLMHVQASAQSPTTFAQPRYQPAETMATASVGTSPRTTFDASRQSVLILDEPTSISPLPSSGLPPTVAGGTLPSSTGFEILDAPPPTGSGAVASGPIIHSTMPYGAVVSPALPPGAILPECFDYSCEPWHWQLLPQGLIYHSYLAGPKEPRMEALLVHEQHYGTLFDGMVGGRVGLLRYGNSADYRPQGWQLDVEGAAFIRQDPEENSDVDGYDFRIGIPVTYSNGRYLMKISWYHKSAHIGDEYVIKHPDFVRINYSRNAFVWGHAYYLTDAFLVYGEVDFGYETDGGNEPWAFQFGVEFSPVVRGFRGAPFAAINAYLREENDYGGPLTVQAGWQWRGARGGQRVRAGFQYQTGPSILEEFYTDSEQQVGGGLWYDF